MLAPEVAPAAVGADRRDVGRSVSVRSAMAATASSATAFSTACAGVGAPGERPVRGDEHRGHVERVEPAPLERLDDHVARARLVLARDLVGGQRPRDRHGAAEVVGVRRPEAGDRRAGLRPRRRGRRVRVDDAAEPRSAR